MGILSEFVTNLTYYYIDYKKKKKTNNPFNIHKCNCKDCEGCDFPEGCAQSEEEDITEDLNKSLNRIKWLISDEPDYDCEDCVEPDYEEEEDEDCTS